MIREEVEEAFRLAAEETLARIRQDRRRHAEHFAPLFRCIEERLFDPGFGVEVARRTSGARRLTPPLGKSLAVYLDEHRLATANRIVELGAGRVPTGRAAAAAGFADYLTWRRTVERCTGERPALVRLPARLRPDLDDVTWHRVYRGELSPDDSRVLLRCLRRLYPGVVDGALPAARPLPQGAPTSISAGRCGGISVAEAEKALERTAVEPRRRLDRDAEVLPRDLARVLAIVAEDLFYPDLTVNACRRRLRIRDASVTTRVRFYLGDTLADLIEKRRIETAVRLLADRRFTIERISEAVGLSCQRFLRKFKLRTGTCPSRVRATLLETSGSPGLQVVAPRRERRARARRSAGSRRLPPRAGSQCPRARRAGDSGGS